MGDRTINQELRLGDCMSASDYFNFVRLKKVTLIITDTLFLEHTYILKYT